MTLRLLVIRYAYSFQDAALKAGSHFQPIHILFDRYDDNSIEAGTRERQSKKTWPIRRDITTNKDALELHIKRTHYQAFVWKQVACQYSDFLNPDEMGWTTDGESGKLVHS